MGVQPSKQNFCQPAGGVALLAPLLRGAGAPAANQQVLYGTGLGVWQLTYYRPAAEIMGTTGAHAGCCLNVRVSKSVLRNRCLCVRGAVCRAGIA